jgi:hypothetical protein
MPKENDLPPARKGAFASLADAAFYVALGLGFLLVLFILFKFK